MDAYLISVGTFAALNGVRFPAALAAGVAAAAATGVITGVASVRVREDFLAITTMGVGFLFLGVVRKAPWFGSEMGISKIPSPGPERVRVAGGGRGDRHGGAE